MMIQNVYSNAQTIPLDNKMEKELYNTPTRVMQYSV